MEMELGVGCFLPVDHTTNGRLGAHHSQSELLYNWISQDEPWTDGEP